MAHPVVYTYQAQAIGLEHPINHTLASKQLSTTAWTGHIASQLSSTHSVLRACLGWVVELGINPNMAAYQKKCLALITTSAFASLIMALPGTLILILMGFGHPFSLLISGVVCACLILGLSGAKCVEWTKALFAFAPSGIILAYTLLELQAGGLSQPMNYLLVRQGLCFALLLPILVYGFEGGQKMLVVIGTCLLALLLYDVMSIREGAFENDLISGLGHGIFTILSLFQYALLAGSIYYFQNSAMQQAHQAERASEKLKSLAIRDGMTGLFNRRFMDQLIGDAINRARRSGNPLALLMIDVDGFKRVNDSFGHNAGDEVLVRLAGLLKNNKRATDYLGRWGGDELVLLLTETNLAGAQSLAEKLRSLVASQAFPYGNHVTISLGASQYQSADNTASFIARADAALYRAKHAGRNRVEVEQKILAISN